MAFIKSKDGPQVGGEQRQRTRDFAGLVAELEDPDPLARRWAARDLRDWPASSGALVARLHRERDDAVREMILTTLTALGDDTVVTALVGCLRSEDVVLRNEAIEALKQLPDKTAPIMGQLLADPDPDVRIFAVNILEGLRHPEVERWLLTVIERDPHLNVCATAVDLLGEVGTAAAREPLLRLAARFADPYIQFATGLALRRIKG